MTGFDKPIFQRDFKYISDFRLRPYVSCLIRWSATVVQHVIEEADKECNSIISFFKFIERFYRSF